MKKILKIFFFIKYTFHKLALNPDNGEMACCHFDDIV